MASVLNVDLDDIFMVEATPVTDEVEDKVDDVLDPDQSRRVRELYDWQGEPVALLTPPAPQRFTVADLLALWERIPHPDDAFADDVEAIQAAQWTSDPPQRRV